MFCSSTLVLFEELGRHANRDGSLEYPNCGVYKKSVEHDPFDCATLDSLKQFLEYAKHILVLIAFKAFLITMGENYL